MALGSGDGLGQVLMYKGQGKAGPISKIAGVNGLFPGGENRSKTGAMQIKDQIHESFYFAGAVDMRLRERWIGRRSQRGEIYVPEDVGEVAVADEGGSVVLDEAESVGSENSRVAVITRLADGDEGYTDETR